MNTFNAATFLDVSQMSDRAVQRLGHADEADVRTVTRTSMPAPGAARQVADLRAAAERFDARRDNFAQGKGATCRDLADKLDRFGSFVSEKQADFARKLVEWSLPRQPAPVEQPMSDSGYVKRYGVLPPVKAPAPAPVPVVRLERLHATMQGMAKLRLGDVTIARKNQDQLCWVKWAGHEQVVGRIDNGVLTVFAQRLRGVTVGEVEARLRVIDLDPKAAAAAHGQASGNCSVCGRDLTDPQSIAIGLGPICAGRFQ